MDPNLPVTLLYRVLVNMTATDETTVPSELNAKILSVDDHNINDLNDMERSTTNPLGGG